MSSGQDGRGPASKWILLFVLLAIQAMSTGAVAYSFGLWVDPVATEFEVQRKAVLGILAAFGIASCAVSAMFGRTLDHGAPRTLLLIGVAALGGGLVLASAAPNLWSLYLVFVIVFPVSVVFAGSLVAISLITRTFEKARGLALGIALTGGSIGGAIIPNIFAALVTDHGWRSANLFLGAFTIVVLFPLVLLVVPAGGAIERVSRGTDSLTARSIFGAPQFWLSVLNVLAFLAIAAAIQPNIAPYAADLGVGLKPAAFLITIFALAIIVGRVAAGYLSDKIALSRLWMIVAVIQMVALASLSNEPGLVRLHISLFLLGLGSGAVAPMQVALFTSLFGAQSVGRVIGLAVPFFAFVSVAASLAAWIRERTGSYDPVFYGAIVITLATIPLILLMGRSSAGLPTASRA